MKKLLLILIALPMIGFGQIFYLADDYVTGNVESFYSLDILTNQYNFIITLPYSDGGYGDVSSFDGLNNILYITNGFGNGGGGDDSTIVIGVDVSTGNFISQDTVPHTIRNFEVWDGMCYYLADDNVTGNDEDFYNLDILTNQYNFITTLPDSDGGYGGGSSFDGLNNILYITNGFGNGGGGDDSTIVIGVDVSSGNFISQDTVPHTISNFEVWDGMCYYLADDNVTGNDEDFYNLDILTNQYNFITTLPYSDGGYGDESSFDGLNNILYITNGFGNGGGGDDSTIVIGVDVSTGNFISQDTVPHTIRNFEVQFPFCLSNASSSTISTCDSYIWSVNGLTYNTSTIDTVIGVNAAGCTETNILDLTITNSTTSTSTETECDSYIWSVNGLTYNTSTIDTVIGVNAAGCTETNILDLTITNSTTSTSTESECDSYIWSVNGLTYNTSTIDTVIGVNAAGCTETNILDLTITNSTTSTSTESECDSYIWSVNGLTYNTSTIDTVIGVNAAGCTETNILDLTITNSTTSTSTESECDSYIWSVNGLTYNTSTIDTVIGVNAAGCTETNILDLTITNSTTSTSTETECDSYIWSVNGLTYNTSTIDTVIGVNAAGCTETNILDLTITNSTTSTSTETECDSYIWSVNGLTYNTSVNDTVIGLNAAGCTETNILDLTIIYSNSSDDTLSVTTSIVWNGMPLNVSGDYSVTLNNLAGCDSIVNLNLTITTTGISDIANNKSNLVKITDMLGQETPYRRNTPLFYIYDDGTVEKRIVIE